LNQLGRGTVAEPVVNASELLSRWRVGDERAGRQLFRTEAPAVLRFFRSKLPASAEDLTQETFVRLFKKPPATTSVRAYLFGIARNVLREAIKRKVACFDPMTMSIADVGQPTSTALRTQQQVLSALIALPLDLQVTVELYYWEGFTSEELGQALGISPNAARTRLTLARRRLRDALGKRMPDRGSELDDLKAWMTRARPST
jgi:RNA polymerase sigma factor (sigma-70 family)